MVVVAELPYGTETLLLDGARLNVAGGAIASVAPAEALRVPLDA
jgi:hypothetical protein